MANISNQQTIDVLLPAPFPLEVDTSGNSVNSISAISTIVVNNLYEISSLSVFLSTSTNDLSGNQSLTSTTITDLSGLITVQDMLSTVTGDLSGSIVSILSINDLLNSHEVLIEKEETDRASVAVFTKPSIDNLKPSLYKWASSGFPGGYAISTLSLNPPELCSDGISRNLTNYFEYLLGGSITSWLDTLAELTHGMIFTFSHNGKTSIVLHVTRS